MSPRLRLWLSGNFAAVESVVAARERSKHPVADTAIETFVGLAVVSAQLDERLCHERVAGFYTCAFEECNDRVFFRRQRVEEFHGAIAETVVVMGQSIGHLKRNDRVDDESGDGGAAEGVDSRLLFGSEIIVAVPEWRQIRREKFDCIVE